MRRLPRSRYVGFALTLLPIGSVHGQSDRSLGVGIGTVRYSGGSTLSTAALTPAFEISKPTSLLALNGTLAVLRGDSYVQGSAAYWGTTAPVVGRWRLAGEAVLTGTHADGAPASGAGQLSGGLVWSTLHWGGTVAAGPAQGWIETGSPVTALRTFARVWWKSADGNGSAIASLEPTRLLGAWFTDASLVTSLTSGPTEVSGWIGARVSTVYGNKGTIGATAQTRVSPRVSLEASGGTVLPDPYQGFPRGAYVSVGIRLHAAGHQAPITPPSFVPLTSAGRDSLVVELRLPTADSATIAGDWNAWTPVPLRPRGSGVWEAVLQLRPGVYHYSVRLDGARWVLPEGVPTVPDGMGGRVALLVVM